jgi:hypothetical protein
LLGCLRGLSGEAIRLHHQKPESSDKRYVGVTSDVTVRVSAHNAGQNRSTARWKPWGIDVIIEFRTERRALRFEKYLKSGAGHAFATSHLVDAP